MLAVMVRKTTRVRCEGMAAEGDYAQLAAIGDGAKRRAAGSRQRAGEVGEAGEAKRGGSKDSGDW